MKSEMDPFNDTEIDIIQKEYYLSRFNITKVCNSEVGQKISSLIEWIEPLSVHARNPFSLLSCPVFFDKSVLMSRFPQYAKSINSTDKINVDHVLIQLQSPSHLDNESFLKRGVNFHHGHRGSGGRAFNYLFDAGTSTFESSLWWFLCTYLERNITFDQIYGWEKTLLEPDNFWEQVPLKIRSRYHFYNTAMSSNVSHGNSVLRIIEEIATENDFVSFKLDIDSPEHEIPSALHLLRNTKLHSLVDEFFFELHFRCEVYMYCGWGWQLPDEQHGLKLNRLSALELFQNLRYAGIRSHFWP